MAKQTILITGATGKQGGAVARHLLEGGQFQLRAMTRKPESEPAKALAKEGVEIVKADLDDERSLAQAMNGVWGVFAVQNTWEAGVEREEEQGIQQAKVARKAGVQHYVYSSVGSAHRKTGIPHFDNKWRVEETVRAQGFPSHVILRPVFFMENLVSPWFLQGDKLTTALDPATKLQMIAVDDIGKYGAVAFEKAAQLNHAEVDIAGDACTMSDAAAALSQGLGRKVTYQRVPMDEMRKSNPEFAIMLEWFERTGYDADISGNEKKFGIKPTRLREWAMQVGGEAEAAAE